MASGIQAQPSLSAEEQGGWRGPPSSPVALEMSVCLKLLVVCVCVTARMRTGCRQLLCSRPRSVPSRCISPQPTCHPEQESDSARRSRRRANVTRRLRPLSSFTGRHFPTCGRRPTLDGISRFPVCKRARLSASEAVTIRATLQSGCVQYLCVCVCM